MDCYSYYCKYTFSLQPSLCTTLDLRMKVIERRMGKLGRIAKCSEACHQGWMDGWMSGWLDGWVDELVDGLQINGR